MEPIYRILLAIPLAGFAGILIALVFAEAFAQNKEQAGFDGGIAGLLIVGIYLLLRRTKDH